MSYDLMVFQPDVAPRTRDAFMGWYNDQTQWSEGHSYDDPAITSNNLRSWFMEMIDSYPALNGPFAKEEDEDNDFVTDYSVGRDVIYVAFPWSLAEQAYDKMKALAQKHKVGFFDASADQGDILFPDSNGEHQPVDGNGNLSSIEQIKKSAPPGQEGQSVKEIIYSKVLPQILAQSFSNNQIKTANKHSWWKKLFGRK
jgi:hypothetical protein